MSIVPEQDKLILRELAKRTMEIANLPVQEEKRRLWRALNGLKPERPMVLIDQVCWNEMDTDDELALRCEHPVSQLYENYLRRNLYGFRHMPVDMVIEPFVVVPKRMTGYQAGFVDWQGKFDFGIKVQEERSVTDTTNEIVGHSYVRQIDSEDDLVKIKPPEIRYLERETNEALAFAQELFGDTMEVKLAGAFPLFWFWDAIVHWCGVEPSLMDMAAEPDFMHALCDRLLKCYLSGLDQLEAQGLLGDHQTLVHCTGAYSSELDQSSAPVGSAKRLWTFNLSQIMGSVSPAMHEEFEAEYSKHWFSRFGLGYYGCCEPLHDRVDMLRKIPNIRKVSISPFARMEAGAEALGRDYVMSRKPNPNVFAAESFDINAIERELKTVVATCRSTGTPLEIIQKDVSTLRYQPQRLWQWAEAAMRAVQQ